MSVFPTVCSSCGGRIPPGAVCPRCAAHPRPSVCSECGARASGGRYCDAHAWLATEAGRLARFPYRRHYATTEYRRNRVLAYERSGGRCEACGVTLPAGSSCDHILPVRDGGGDELANLRWLCPECVQAKNRADKAHRKEGDEP